MQISNLYDKYNNLNNQKLDSNINIKNTDRSQGIQNLKAGDVFEGTVISVKNNKVEIALADGQKVMARLEDNVNVTKGQALFFEVKSASATTIEITPYRSGEEGNNPILTKALREASIEINAKTIDMINEMMHESMPIDKESLAKMYKILSNFENINVKTLVQMTKLDIPITEQRAFQYENYLDDKQAITNKLNDVLTNLVKDISDPSIPIKQIETNNVKLLDIVSKEIETVKIDQILGEKEITALLESLAKVEESKDEGNDFLKMLKSFQSGIINEGEGQTTSQDVSSKDALKPDGLINNNGILENTNKENEQSALKGNIAKETLQEENVIRDNISKEVEPQENGAKDINSQGNIKQEAYQNEIAKQDTTFQKEVVQQNTVSQNEINQSSNNAQNRLEVGDLVDKIKALLNNTSVNEKEILSFVSSKEYKGFVESIIKEQWLIEPEQLKENGKITQLYKKLDFQISQIEELVNAIGQNKSGLMSTLSEIRGNLDFMNQINNVYNYVQIPLKMAKQDVNGELYLYTSKKNLKEKKGELSAFLHLELDNLGTTDVAIKLHDKNLKTNFFVEDDVSYDLILSNLPMLLSRLKKLGYTCSLDVINERKKMNFVDDFLKKDLPTAGPVKRFSFDMRA
ncbi:flagellar hook-length control protein FliK [Lachnobacterium bovis]|uniref:flagellar hook-length control protein FliK n=1 Tax=Lachnobacterium bovis TaxID=140626 RepID=UPI00049119F4|nr:flagellar hook-length control protein FliK [Lachnobacterium bovis]